MVNYIEKILKIENLLYSPYKNLTFKNINITITKGEVVGLLGKNGAGKSTMLMKIAGFGKEAQGQMKLDNKDIYTNPKNYRSMLGSVIDATNFYPSLTGEENLKIILGTIDHYVNENINDFQMQDHMKKKVKNYSLGMKQKLKLIASLTPGKKLILLDEPTNGLDPQSLAIFNLKIKSLKSQETAILISSHHINDLKTYCTRFFLLHNGQLKEINSQKYSKYKLKVSSRDIAKQILTNYKIEDSRKDESTIIIDMEESNVNKVLTILINGNVQIEELKKIENIETEFLKETR